MTHAVRASLISLALLVALVTPAFASTTSPFVGTFRETFGRGNAPSGVGSLAGMGLATESFLVTDSTPDDGCFLDGGITTISFADGDVVLREDNRLCTPGASGQAPGSQVSYGNPVTWTGTYTITGGTGAYAGATGAGTAAGQLAGDIIVIRYNGTITLP